MDDVFKVQGKLNPFKFDKLFSIRSGAQCFGTLIKKDLELNID